ncbi:hypothetical protein ACFO3J_34185 [Streptomyces polygonati]|uniref:Uncharacterized protein n=1 Tax=Streptomyces polygonati TaxID=1617087 RepID=A0ABV8I318_9ACTN
MTPRRRSHGGLEDEIRAVAAAGDQPMTPAQVREALGGKRAYPTVLTVLTRLYEGGAAPPPRGVVRRLPPDAPSDGRRAAARAPAPIGPGGG